jgi:UDP-N-acetylmuramoyl-tripeptide--D-alanyl-D-alanine ligase
MKGWTPDQVARAANARLIAPTATTGGPEQVVIDSREAGPGALFVGLKGANDDGGRFASQALGSGAWGVLTTPTHAEGSRNTSRGGVLLTARDPLAALQRLARAWRRQLDARVIGVTGSTGKTSTKDLLLAVLAPHRRTVASRANLNTEIGLPLEILAAPRDTEVLVLEMAMRGPGQIAELAEIAEPEVGVIVSIGPVHLEVLGSLEAIAATKAELIAALPANGTAVVPANEPLLEPHLRRNDIEVVTFGPNSTADVHLTAADTEHVEIDHNGEQITLQVPFTQVHQRTNLLAAVAAAKAIGVTPSGRVRVALSPGRGQRRQLPGGITLIDDCYNANPMSMRAALDDLAATAEQPPDSRRVAVLGDMLELGPDELRFHQQLGRHASAIGVDLLITVGPLARAIADDFDGEAYSVSEAAEAAAIAEQLLQPRDVILVKASRGVGLELVCNAIAERAPA